MMIKSMTAFARVQEQLHAAHLCWEIKSVNHRYLDVSFRMPESFRYLETELRAMLKNTVSRGKLECQLKFQDNNTEIQSMLINKGIVNALVTLGGDLASSFKLSNDLSVSDILQWPGAVQMAQRDVDIMQKPILSLFHEALLQLNQFRATEGEALKKHINTRIAALVEQVHKARIEVSLMKSAVKDKLLARLHSVQMEVAESRVEQEIALILTRLDVSEELDRLETHIDEVSKALNGAHNAGRRLDFLMQELNREANTLGSKSDSTALTQCAIEMKVLTEQMREQIQNIE